MFTVMDYRVRMKLLSGVQISGPTGRLFGENTVTNQKPHAVKLPQTLKHAFQRDVRTFYSRDKEVDFISSLTSTGAVKQFFLMNTSELENLIYFSDRFL